MTNTSTQRVIKTLIIGLGSTGTRICNAVAERVRWELKDVKHAPWLQFLCVETNANEESPFHETGDFINLRISAADYEQILTNPQAYDEKISLSRWIDRETLQKLPNKDVSAGAGNIRMVGRLAFLFQENYNQLKQAVHHRLTVLRTLTEIDAMELRGPLADGSEPAIEFAADGEVRVIVVGTLCGGTCSGLVSDFGYFLKSLCTGEEKVIAFITLPKNDLTTSLEPAANKYKSNAYHALVELNHYHLAGREAESPIRFSDGINPDTNTFPYDLTFLSMPRSSGTTGEVGLNRALADRIFLDVFVPQTDPFAEAINAPVIDREHRAHVFCSFGLSSIEFPAYQVMEACQKRLLAHALREWSSRALNADEEQAALQEMGLTWEGVTGALCEQRGAENIQHVLRKKISEVVLLARSNIEQAQKSIDEIRAAFDQGVQQGPGMYRGMVGDRLMSSRSQAAEIILQRVRGYVSTHLLDYYEGPAPLLQLLNKAQERIQQLQNVPLISELGHSESVNNVMQRLRSYHTSRLLGFFWMRKRSIAGITGDLRQAMESEIRDRLTNDVGRALHTIPIKGGSDAGMLQRVSKLLNPVQKRVANLRTAVTALVNQLNERANELARTEPVMNGLAIFEPETPMGGRFVRNTSDVCKGKATTRRKAGNGYVRWWRRESFTRGNHYRMLSYQKMAHNPVNGCSVQSIHMGEVI